MLLSVFQLDIDILAIRPAGNALRLARQEREEVVAPPGRDDELAVRIQRLEDQLGRDIVGAVFQRHFVAVVRRVPVVKDNAPVEGSLVAFTAPRALPPYTLPITVPVPV